MSGIVGSSHNIRGSGIVAKLGTDGQVFTSAGAGVSQTFEAAAGGGKMGQVVQTAVTDIVTTTSGGGSAPLVFEALTGMTVDITPVATSSKVLVMVQLYLSNANGGNWTEYQIFRDTTQIYLGDADGVLTRTSGVERDGSSGMLGSCSSIYLDSPSSTSEVTYLIKWACEDGTTGCFNRAGNPATEFQWPRTASSITVMEVLA